MAMLRSRSSGRPSAERSAVATRVKSVKLQTSPATIAYGPPPVAGGPAREDDRQDRQDARRDRGDDARDERDSDEQAHALIVDPRSERFLTRAGA